MSMVQRRILFLLLMLLGAVVLLGGRLAYLQLWQNEFYQAKALEQRLQRIPIEGLRGGIYDRNGVPLAVSVSAHTVYAIPAEVEDAEATAQKLAAILSLDEEFILQRLQKHSAVEWLKKKITDEDARAVITARLPGIGVVPSSTRIYPYGSVAPQVLGFVGIDNQGLEGLELYYDDFLRGTPGETIFERDAQGRALEDGVRGYLPGQRGGDLILTIDIFIQRIAEEEVRRATLETGSRLGLILVSDPQTGEILATAIYPSFDLENFADYPAANRKNIAVTDTYEPGSTFKAVTAALALEEGVATLQSGFFDPGYIRVSGWNVRCWNRGGHGPQSFVETMQNSCNPYYAKLAIDLGPERFYDGLVRFNLGHKTGIDFPGEMAGILRAPSPSIPLVTWANMGFGQGLTVTPVQLLACFGAIANKGIYTPLHYVKELVTEEGSFPPDIPEARQVIAAEIAETTAYVLRMAVERGSGKRAEVPGYDVAGKTGTAQLVEHGRYSHSKMVTSFAGFAPKDDPKMAALLVLWEPQGAFYGGIIASPVFARLAEKVLTYLGVERKATSRVSQVRQVIVPDVGGLDVEEAAALLRRQQFRVEVVGPGTRVIGQVPAPKAEVDVGSLVYIYTDLESGEEVEAAADQPSPYGA
ncbi:penicillin-binding transpeptidase domain-containing protein [Candidatus Darwinibacter acetoxidans]|jgi:stage V sporulation protein D (sporulation-specific penicillin-binding protein)|nr:penicillin-binding transpeptidase domain-containing protein [Limnochordia bacterium]MDI9464534.1 penicillin-binding transpeptidase domain-containing protein [Bacillota bacterium]NLO95956.1 PASTA domain-containing protein [Bacillota bacterium]HAN94741.1 stage V sporulation protein D [Bacillota bacterium]HOK30480.1 penicillin-binding transpeptidase domain-containing protein [Limnochordia bacterium]